MSLTIAQHLKTGNETIAKAAPIGLIWVMLPIVHGHNDVTFLTTDTCMPVSKLFFLRNFKVPKSQLPIKLNSVYSLQIGENSPGSIRTIWKSAWKL